MQRRAEVPMAAPGVPRCGGGSLGLLVWLLVFQPLLSEARAGRNERRLVLGSSSGGGAGSWDLAGGSWGMGGGV